MEVYTILQSTKKKGDKTCKLISLQHADDCALICEGKEDLQNALTRLQTIYTKHLSTNTT